jgi:D-beta-D-heptose 7-phosphate kinase / D-beta-D-heptose 1-phosphate adenosyltransferase
MNRISPSEPPQPDQPDADLVAAVRSLANTAVLVIGDVILDRYTYGEVERISHEAPIPILSVNREVALPGGAGTVVRNLTALGAAVAFISVLGDDQAGADLTGLVGGQLGVEPWLLVEGGRTTAMKSRFLAAGQQLFRADREDCQPVSPRLAERMLRIAGDAMAATTVTVLSDYGQGVLAGDVPAQLVAMARDMGRKVIVDPRGPDHTRYAGADIIMPNRRDLAAATRMPVDSEGAIVAAATRLREAHRFGAVLVTQGNDGMTLVDDAGWRHFPAEAAEVYDVSGSGDTALATLAAAMAARLDVDLAVRLANLAAGVVVGKAGIAVARHAELLAALSPQRSALRKIVPREEAAEQVERWRRRGWRVGFTNGCFDLLHPGHVHLLEEARSRCDRLVVGLNSDASVRRLKGSPRPVQPEAARAALLASFASVDLVVVFQEDTPEALIAELRPDLLMKGADYKIDEVVGADLVRGWGGEVALADLLPGHSTTATLARIRA